jgi:hypothetical protein
MPGMEKINSHLTNAILFTGSFPVLSYKHSFLLPKQERGKTDIHMIFALQIFVIVFLVNR